MAVVRRHGTAALSGTSITVEIGVRKGDPCFSFVPIASAAMLTSHPSRPRRESVRSSAPSVGPARKVCSLGGVPTVAGSWWRGLGVPPRNWQSILLQPSASSSPRGVEGMQHRRCEREHPLPTWSAVPPMTPNHALHPDNRKRRFACFLLPVKVAVRRQSCGVPGTVV